MYLDCIWALQQPFFFYLSLYFTYFTLLYTWQDSLPLILTIQSSDSVCSSCSACTHTHTLIVYTEVHTSTCIRITQVHTPALHQWQTKTSWMLAMMTVLCYSDSLLYESMTTDINVHATTGRMSSQEICGHTLQSLEEYVR